MIVIVDSRSGNNHNGEFDHQNNNEETEKVASDDLDHTNLTGRRHRRRRIVVRISPSRNKRKYNSFDKASLTDSIGSDVFGTKRNSTRMKADSASNTVISRNKSGKPVVLKFGPSGKRKKYIAKEDGPLSQQMEEFVELGRSFYSAAKTIADSLPPKKCEGNFVIF